MADAKRDQNSVPTLLGVSSVDGITPVVLWADPTTHRLLTDAASGMTNPMTTGGDTIYGGVGGTPTRLANGTAGQVLTSQGTTLAPIWSSAGAGDMILASAQTVSGAKTFLDATLLMRNVANTFSSKFTNTNTAARTYTLKDADGTIAFTSDITGTNSGTNTGDVTLGGTPTYITIAGQVITRNAVNLTTDVTGTLPINKGGTNQTAFTAKSGNIAGIVYYDGTSLANDATVSHLGYDTVTDTVYTGAINISTGSTQTAKFTNTAAQSTTGGAGMQGYADSGAAMTSGNRLGFYALGGAVDGAHTTANVAIIEAFATENWSGTATGNNVVFSTTANTTTTRSAVLTLGQDKTSTFGGTVVLGSNSITMTGSIAATGARVTKVWATDSESTNMPTVGGTAILTSLTAPQFTTIELGNASDTTLSRSAAGVMAVEGVVIPSISSTNTLTNKRITKRVLALSANSATPAINTDSYDVVNITGQSAAITSFTSSLTGTPVDGDTLRISITGTGAIALTWGTSFESSTVTLPTTTVTTARLDVGFFWNSATSKWRCVATC